MRNTFAAIQTVAENAGDADRDRQPHLPRGRRARRGEPHQHAERIQRRQKLTMTASTESGCATIGIHSIHGTISTNVMRHHQLLRFAHVVDGRADCHHQRADREERDQKENEQVTDQRRSSKPNNENDASMMSPRPRYRLIASKLMPIWPSSLPPMS